MKLVSGAVAAREDAAMVTINSVRDIETWICNSRPDASEHIELVRDAIQAADHPAYGADWSAWLDATVTPAWLADVVAKALRG